jgi:hypothetical protein
VDVSLNTSATKCSNKKHNKNYSIEKMQDSPSVVLWFQNLRNINDQLDAKDRKEQIKADACWDELILTLTNNIRLNALIDCFLG